MGIVFRVCKHAICVWAFTMLAGVGLKVKQTPTSHAKSTRYLTSLIRYHAHHNWYCVVWFFSYIADIVSHFVYLAYLCLTNTFWNATEAPLISLGCLLSLKGLIKQSMMLFSIAIFIWLDRHIYAKIKRFQHQEEVMVNNSCFDSSMMFWRKRQRILTSYMGCPSTTTHGTYVWGGSRAFVLAAYCSIICTGDTRWVQTSYSSGIQMINIS